MKTSEYQEAKTQLIQRLSANLADSFFEDSEGPTRLAQMLSEGFGGFSSLTVAQLLQSAVDAGLDERYPAIVDVLEAGEQAAGTETNVRKTIVQFKVLHQDNSDLADASLSVLAYECDAGCYVGGELTVVSSELLTQAALEVEAGALGSEAAFFIDPEN